MGQGRALQVQIQPPWGPSRCQWKVVDPEENRPLLSSTQPPGLEELLSVTGVAIPRTRIESPRPVHQEMKWEDLGTLAPPPTWTSRKARPEKRRGPPEVCWGPGWPSALSSSLTIGLQATHKATAPPYPQSSPSSPDPSDTSVPRETPALVGPGPPALTVPPIGHSWPEDHSGSLAPRVLVHSQAHTPSSQVPIVCLVWL